MKTLYAHINNGGLSFSVGVDEQGIGPVLRIESSHFANNVHRQDFFMTPAFAEGLAKLLLDNCHQGQQHPIPLRLEDEYEQEIGSARRSKEERQEEP